MAKDPEGETIERDLIHRGGYDSIRAVRSGKYLRMLVKAEDPGRAKEIVMRMCNELRLFNPVVHSCSVSVKSGGGKGGRG
jgi:phosphoribosylformylglycinamidine synthase PurS subunit